ncbi:ABC transporter ATP-binding protein [Alteribacillus sp. HJP-4]|uniref:ABC transporter ATP-binding protein n=1 Tax=Alteribacillus sp. HJP-4 TaxID=2775394 RepID=UPI0035CD041A
MEKVIEARKVTKKIRGKTLIDDMSITVREGEICGFLGPNGAGKTTLMRMLTSLVKPTHGELFIEGVDVHKQRRLALKKVGAIIESPIFFEFMTGRKMLKNLARLHNLSKRQQKEKVEEVLKAVGLSERGDDKIKTYSLGMKQRLGIAQSLLGNPKVIILDEPANGLDPMGMRELRELILKLNDQWGITFFISSHLLDELQKICSRLVIIKEGVLLYEGTQEGLSKENDRRLEDLFVEMMSS